jgi:hypothetical protein
MYKVVCLDERAAVKEYDVVKDGAEFHRPVATFYKKHHATVWALFLNGDIRMVPKKLKRSED